MDELVIKVPAPFTGIEDLGFSARYPAQEPGEPLRDVPFFVEGPPRPMQVLVERLALFAEKDAMLRDTGDDDAYTWTPPIRLTDEVCVLAFRDRSLQPRLADAAATTADLHRGYVWNLVRPLAFTFLRDCVRIGGLRLAERISVVLDTGTPPTVDLEMQRAAITPTNGTLLLFRA
ncbi:MAG: hypothetical protein JOZ46_04865 [Candidatus Dormibacteraeota bacterium]|nr:hypothetical protein [Candidatus Dormibacteraeota bacterium]MBV9525130.1 hypothetical protein [Candidatus Dormibacteraeota bacterium]